MAYVSVPRSASAVFPKALFKAVPTEFVEDLLAHGQIRVGTLADFRAIESEGAGVRDEEEGLRTIRINSFQDENVRIDDLPYPLNSLGVFPQGSVASLDMRRCTYADHDRDCYLVSASLTLDAAAAIYPSGVRILDPLAFGRVVGARLTQLGLSPHRSLGAAKCIYVSKEQELGSLHDVPLAFQKSEKFRPQEEFRFAWLPSNGVSPAPIVQRIPDLCVLMERAW
jgi:hypothetical protein